MAFTITTNGTVTTYQGTDGVDTAAIASLPTGSTSVDVFGEGADDVVNWGITLTSSSIRGGSGNDILTPNIIAGATLISSFLNGNGGNDTIGNPQLGVPGTLSTISGGQGSDTIYVGNLQSSLVNGNLGDDIITTGVETGATVNTSDSSIFGGQGNDRIVVGDGADGSRGNSNNSGYINTIIDGNLGDDVIEVDLDNRRNVTLFQNSIIAGGEGNDRINADGSEPDLTLDGGTGRDTIIGGYGDDIITGGSGEDSLLGGSGADTINGGDEDDVLNGGSDSDRLTGGTGSNRFVQRNNSTSNASFTPDIGGLAGLDAGDTFDFGSVDVVTDWATGSGTNKIDTGVLGLAINAAFNPPTSNQSYGATLPGAFAQNYAIRGNFNAANGTFVVTPQPGFTGGDILVFTLAANATNFGDATNYTVLQGAGNSQLSASDFVVV
ncbi:calcium-binding protein [Vulcanococcus limneticus]|uniref:calcium-binding protein n=1 Tax=Vulcanococcus limneticus TaxID=2170428 RepID=UPI00398C1BD7